MTDRYIQQVSGHLASQFGVNASEIEVKREPTRYTGAVQLLLNGQIVGLVSGLSADNWMPGGNFKLPASEAGKLIAPFSMKNTNGIEISGVDLTYYIDAHPELAEVLNDLRVNHRIPGHRVISGNTIISQKRDGSVEAKVNYILVESQGRLCTLVDPEHVKYVPEAREQPEQAHFCIHGESAPVNPFDIEPKDFKKISVVHIGLNRLRYNEICLEETLRGLPMPADGLELSYSGHSKFVRLRTPTEPFVQINIQDPSSEENWRSQIALARQLEAMFK